MIEFSAHAPNARASDSEARPSGSVIVLRDGTYGLEVLLLQRNPALRNMGGAWVFPGGKVDPEDPGETLEARARFAALRELHEEAGLRLSADTLEDFSHWLTPLGVKQRFATWFYAAAVPADVAVRVDGSEMVAHCWLAPQAALDAQRSGELAVPPPTLVTLNDLAPYRDCAAALAMAASRQPPYFFPQIVQHPTGMVFLYPGDAGYESLDPEAPGPRHRTEARDGQFRYLRDVEWQPRNR